MQITLTLRMPHLRDGLIVTKMGAAAINPWEAR
jgi:hypothetical protein